VRAWTVRKMILPRRWLGLCIAVAVLTAPCREAPAQSGRTIKLIVPVPAGASTDFVARLMADEVSRMHGVTVVVENRPGASGMIGTEAASRAAPDGGTLLVTANTYLIDAQTRKASYHPVTAFEPICFLVASPAVLVVNGASPYRTLADLLDAARAKPGELSMASVGPGTTFQMGFATFTATAKVTMTFVPYAGSAPAVNAVLGQHVTSAFAGYAVVSEQIKGGLLRALAVATSKRIDPLPDVPTFDASGFKNLEVDNWFGIVAPAGTPKPTIDELGGWFAEALKVPEVKAKLALQGLYPVGMCGAEFAEFVRKRYDEYGEAIRATGLKPQ
jgi:tripartite-type tricarboxylate transporter receptor subunit TctC